MLWALIMAGGWGTRLWPLSHRAHPKPLLKLIPECDTLLNETVKRLAPAIPPSRVFIIGNQEHVAALKKCKSGVPANQILGEPVSKNTGPTVAIGASLILKRDPQAMILILPADHWIKGKAAFQKCIKQAARFSDRHEQFSIFGIKPKSPSSAYGYILRGKKRAASVYNLKRFIEKPSVQKARKFVRSGKYLWHAGIFLASGANILASIARYAPNLARALRKINVKNGRFLNPGAFRALPNVSFDYAVLEKMKNATLIQCRFEWCDVGSWNAMDQIWPIDSLKNAAFTKCFPLESAGNVVYAKNKLVCLQGVHDLVVIDTPHALFVGQKHAGEKMRDVVKAVLKQ